MNLMEFAMVCTVSVGMFLIVMLCLALIVLDWRAEEKRKASIEENRRTLKPERIINDFIEK